MQTDQTTGTRARPRRRFIINALLLAVIGILIIWFAFGKGEWPKTLRIITGTPGGTYINLGEALADVLSKLSGVDDATAISSAGAVENIKTLIKDDADLAFVQDLALRSYQKIDPRTASDLRALAYLYPDVVQIVIRPGLEISDLNRIDPAALRIYVGKKDSGTRLVARNLLGVAEFETDIESGNSVTEPVADPADDPDSVSASEPGGPGGTEDTSDGPAKGSYTWAARELRERRIDVAIFAAGTPTSAVTDALNHECQLLPLDTNQQQALLAKVPGSVPVNIPAFFYEKQELAVHTIGIPVYLVGRTELADDLVAQILDCLFDNIADLLLAHSGVGDIKLQLAFSKAPPITWHDGKRQFEEDELTQLNLLTGTLTGRYHKTGRQLAQIFEFEGIRTRALHSDGSLANALRIMQQPGRTLAIMQYDIALAVGRPERIYDKKDLVVGKTPLEIPNLTRIATLHEEVMHIVIRRDKLTGLTDAEKSSRLTVAALAGKKICLGPEDSGSALAARNLLDLHGLTDQDITHLSVRDMVNQLRAKTIAAGFFVSGTPSEAMALVLEDPDFRLLSIDNRLLQRFIGSTSAIKVVTIPPTYGCQLPDEPPIVTLSTRAVLVASNDIDYDIEKLTKAIIRDADFLGLEGGPKAMAAELLSLPLHRDAKKAYQDEGHLASPDRPSLVEVTAAALSIIVIFFGTAKAARILVRERIVNQIKGRILDVTIDHAHPRAIRKLVMIRTELRMRARKSWWHPGQLDKSRWNDVKQILDNCIQEAKSNLMRTLLFDVKALLQPDDSSDEPDESALRDTIWQHAANGELDETQVDLVLKALDQHQGVR